jgi:hypothetical protein
MQDKEYWKALAKERREENKALVGRVRELTESRDKWKKKAMEAGEEIKKERKIADSKKKAELKKCTIKPDKPNRSHYQTSIILSVITAKLQTSVSFRSISKVIMTIVICMKINISKSSTPSRNTGLLWVKKTGYYCLTKEKEKAEDWILILDESIGIGQEKLLVILGIRKSKIPANRPLTLQDMEPMIIKSRTQWRGEDITVELEKCKTMLSGILYAVTDGGSDLKKALNQSGISRVYDVTHAIAVMLSKLYEQDEVFKRYINLMNSMRQKHCCSQYAFLIPPGQRSKSRFLNIEILSNWGMKALSLLQQNTLSEQNKAQLIWVKEYESFIKEMNSIVQVIESVSVILKYKGLSKKTSDECKIALQQCKGTKRQTQFKRLFNAYLKENMVIITKRKESLLCTSDVIESSFGHYKDELNENPMSGITDMALIIAALTANLDTLNINEVIDSCTCKKLKTWRQECLCESLQSKRNKFFKSTG